VDSEGGEEVVSEIEEDLEVEVDHQVVVSEEDLQGAGSEVVEVDSVVVVDSKVVVVGADSKVEEATLATVTEVVVVEGVDSGDHLEEVTLVVVDEAGTVEEVDSGKFPQFPQSQSTQILTKKWTTRRIRRWSTTIKWVPGRTTRRWGWVWWRWWIQARFRRTTRRRRRWIWW